jgi:hypothetical protein
MVDLTNFKHDLKGKEDVLLAEVNKMPSDQRHKLLSSMVDGSRRNLEKWHKLLTGRNVKITIGVKYEDS